MEAVAHLVSALAEWAWPTLALLALIWFKPPLTALLETLRRRKFSLKVGDQELTIEEATNEERQLIADLQSQVLGLKDAVEAFKSKPQEMPKALAVAGPPKRILWVDDNPKNNSFFIQQLDALGVRVDVALSTNDAKEAFGKFKYDYVISDMGRKEAGGVNPFAGLEFLKWARSWNRDIPLILFCSPHAAHMHQSAALEAGATAITSSGTQLLGLLKLNELRDQA